MANRHINPYAQARELKSQRKGIKCIAENPFYFVNGYRHFQNSSKTLGVKPWFLKK